MVVTIVLWWSLIGACVWVLLDAAGIIEAFCRERNARGMPPTAMGLVLATLFTIVAWPWFAWPMLCRAWRKWA
jgi:hypothetical protein